MSVSYIWFWKHPKCDDLCVFARALQFTSNFNYSTFFSKIKINLLEKYSFCLSFYRIRIRKIERKTKSKYRRWSDTLEFTLKLSMNVEKTKIFLLIIIAMNGRNRKHLFNSTLWFIVFFSLSNWEIETCRTKQNRNIKIYWNRVVYA